MDPKQPNCTLCPMILLGDTDVAYTRVAFSLQYTPSGHKCPISTVRVVIYKSSTVFLLQPLDRQNHFFISLSTYCVSGVSALSLHMTVCGSLTGLVAWQLPHDAMIFLIHRCHRLSLSHCRIKTRASHHQGLNAARASSPRCAVWGPQLQQGIHRHRHSGE